MVQIMVQIKKTTYIYFTCKWFIINRAENGIRTHDPQLGKLMLYP